MADGSFEIRRPENRPVEVGTAKSRYLPGFIASQVVSRTSSINSYGSFPHMGTREKLWKTHDSSSKTFLAEPGKLRSTLTANWFRKYPLPETKPASEFTPENGWLEDDILWIYPPPSNSGKWRFIGIPY